MPWKKSPLRHFESIPEVSPTGALIKVCYAGAYPKSAGAAIPASVSTNGSPWRHPPLDRDGSLGSSGSGDDHSDGDQSPPQQQQQQLQQQQQIKPEMILAGMLFKKRKRTRAQNSMKDTGYRELEQHFHHRFEMSGRVAMLGEDVEDETELAVGDAVIVLPFPGQQINYGDTVCVPNLSYLVRLPEDIPLTAESVSVLAGARIVLSMVKLLQAVVSSNNFNNPKLLVVGERSLLTWFLHITKLLDIDDNSSSNFSSVTVATDSDSLIASQIKSSSSNSSRVNLVHWSEEAYQASLVEQTREACGGCSADLVLSLEASTKALRTAVACLAKDGPVLMSSESLSWFPAYSRRALEKRIVKTVSTTDATQNQTNCAELISLIKSDLVVLPPVSSFAPDGCGRIKKLQQLGQLEGSAVVKFASADDEK